MHQRKDEFRRLEGTMGIQDVRECKPLIATEALAACRDDSGQ